jgi:hypothetical protein
MHRHERQPIRDDAPGAEQGKKSLQVCHDGDDASAL